MDKDTAEALADTLAHAREDWENVPETLKDISAELTLIRKALEQIAARLEAGI